LITRRIGLCDAVPQWQIQLQPDSIGGEVVSKDLPQGTTQAAQVYNARRYSGGQIQTSGQAAVYHGCDHVQLGFHRIERALQTDLSILHLNRSTRQIGTILNGCLHHVLQRTDGILLRNRH
jgi:hypothetical protein